MGKHIDNERGSALIWAMLFAIVLSILSLAMLSLSVGSYNRSYKDSFKNQAYYTAKSVLDTVVKSDREGLTKQLIEEVTGTVGMDSMSNKYDVKVPEDMGECKIYSKYDASKEEVTIYVECVKDGEKEVLGMLFLQKYVTPTPTPAATPTPLLGSTEGATATPIPTPVDNHLSEGNQPELMPDVPYVVNGSRYTIDLTKQILQPGTYNLYFDNSTYNANLVVSNFGEHLSGEYIFNVYHKWQQPATSSSSRLYSATHQYENIASAKLDTNTKNCTGSATATINGPTGVVMYNVTNNHIKWDGGAIPTIDPNAISTPTPIPIPSDMDLVIIVPDPNNRPTPTPVIPKKAWEADSYV